MPVVDVMAGANDELMQPLLADLRLLILELGEAVGAKRNRKQR